MDLPGAISSSSAGSTTTYESPMSKPLTISSGGTSSPVRSFTLLFRTRSDVPRWIWLKWMVWLSVAVNSWTGMATSPNESAPLQTARAMARHLPVASHPTPSVR